MPLPSPQVQSVGRHTGRRLAWPQLNNSCSRDSQRRLTGLPPPSCRFRHIRVKTHMPLPSDNKTHSVIVVSELRRSLLSKGVALVRTQFTDWVSGCAGSQVVLYQSRSSQYPTGYFASGLLTHADVHLKGSRFLLLRLADIVQFRSAIPVLANQPVIESYARHSNGQLHERRFAHDF